MFNNHFERRRTKQRELLKFEEILVEAICLLGSFENKTQSDKKPWRRGFPILKLGKSK